ncbi:MAG: hypothetical protein K6T90_17925 [Leptolyngbyaceae cyanobacterium HOT.MB2.61]|nr:hypothetical protein [Leptolyngbyaceae cyanobacterium HOT.MB2.61]
MKERYIHWQDEERWLGYPEKYPDEWTQAQAGNELKENLADNLADIYKELTSGTVPSI